jgi:hypothetical protein
MAHKEDVYFDRNEIEYYIIPDRKDVWQKQVEKVILTLQEMVETKSLKTIFIGN